MNLVLDTNVLIAAFVAHGTCAELFEQCGLEHSIVTSKELLDELRSVLTRKFGYSPAEVREAVDLVQSRAQLVSPLPLPAPMSRDPDDDIVLATALAGKCSCIVTGDNDLLVLREFQGIAILAPAQFWEFEARWV